MHIFNIPDWVDQSLLKFEKLEEIPSQVFDSINLRLDQIISTKPEVSILIAAWNEEANIVRCVDSLSKTKAKTPFEIIVINNNSKDHTQQSLEKLHIKRLFQEKQGCGPSRQLGQEKALGKYILLADADCLYPPNWIDKMVDQLKKPGVVCVYGRYSFLAFDKSLRIKLFIYEKLKDLVTSLRHWKRPYLNAYGISMGYLKDAGLKVGYIDHNTWGDDGRLAFDMMKYGKIVQMKSGSARVWTGYRSLLRDGTLKQAFMARLVKEIVRFRENFYKKEEHDTKTSKNPSNNLEDNINLLKEKFRV